MLRWSFFLLSYFIVCAPSFALSPEQVLGDYWNDPLFGEAAAARQLRLEVLHKKIWPQQSTVVAGEVVRIVLDNRHNDAHVILISGSSTPQVGDALQQRIEDDLAHVAANRQHTGHHHSHHAHDGNDADTSNAVFIKTPGPMTTLTVAAGMEKELLLRFDKPGSYFAACVHDAHWQQGYLATISVIKEETTP